MSIICNYQAQVSCVTNIFDSFNCKSSVSLFCIKIFRFDVLLTRCKKAYLLAEKCNCPKPCYNAVTEIEMIQQGEYLFYLDGSIKPKKKKEVRQTNLKVTRLQFCSKKLSTIILFGTIGYNYHKDLKKQEDFRNSLVLLGVTPL